MRFLPQQLIILISLSLLTSCGGTLGGNPEKKEVISGESPIRSRQVAADTHESILDFPSEENPGLRVYLSDAPLANIKSLWITIAEVRAKTKTGWIDLSLMEDPNFDLLTLRDGKRSALASAVESVDDISELRLKLSSTKAPRLILADDSEAKLKIPSSESSGIKIKTTFSSSQQSNILLDFDVKRSLHAKGDGSYHMIPVIIAHDLNLAGQLAGENFAIGSTICVYPKGSVPEPVEPECDDALAVKDVDENGKFYITALEAGEYTALTFIDKSEKQRSEISIESNKKTVLTIE